MSALRRPGTDEHNPFYGRYIDLVPDGDIVETLTSQLGETLALLQGVPEERETFAYAPSKWTIRQVVGHLVDTERVMAYRAMHIARTDDADLPGMEQDDWVAHSNADRRPLVDLASEWGSVRRANLHFFATLDPESCERHGRAAGSDFTVRCFPWIIAGHELWHRNLLEKDYGVSAIR